MQKGRVLKFSEFSQIFTFLKRNKIVLLLVLLFLSGFIFGIITFGKHKNFDNLIIDYLHSFIQKRQNGSFSSVFIGSFLHSLSFVFLGFCLGTSMFGIITSPFIITYFGVFLGSVSSLLYSEYSLKGVAFYTVLILPVNIFLVLALILSSCESIKFSYSLATLTFKAGVAQNIIIDFKKYCIKNLTYVLLVIVSALLDGIISHNFLKSFSLY